MRRLVALVAAVVLAGSAAQAATPPPTTDKVVVFVIENHSAAQVKAGAPRMWALGQTYSYATNFTAIRHPSLPNYVAMMSGSTQGITNDSFHKVSAPNVLSGAIANGRSGKVVMDGMFTDRCRQSNYKKYAWRHNPWVPFTGDRALCEKYDFDLKYLPGDVAASKLANVEFIIPNLCNDAHNCSLSTADKWVASKVALLQSGPDWKSGRLTIVLTADEDNGTAANTIFTAVLHPSLSHKVVTSPLNLYSLSGMLSDFGHSPRLLNAKTAPDMAQAFGLTVN